MTAPRLARGGGRFFVGLTALILMVGFIAIFHSSQQQLDESRQLRLRCEQQQEALNTRMQSIVEHKSMLEKSLEGERKEHLEVKQMFEQKAKEQKDIHSKATLEAGVRFDSLQQHYKLLQSEHTDLIEDCAKSKKNQLEEINGMKSRVNSVQSQIQQSKSQHDKDVEHWKAKYSSLENENQRLRESLRKTTEVNNKNPEMDTLRMRLSNLEKVINNYKRHCSYQPQDDYDENGNRNLEPKVEPLKSGIEKFFNEQIPIIPKPLVNNDDPVPNINKNSNDHSNSNNVDNRIDNNNVLQHPPPMSGKTSTPTAHQNKTSEDLNKQAQAVPFISSSGSPLTSDKIKRSSTRANSRQKESSGRAKSKQVPVGVVPVPANFDAMIKNENNLLNGNNNNNNNRYANVVDEVGGKRDETEQENVAHEVKDDFNIADEKNDGKDHLQEVLENMNNAAEDDTNNLYDTKLIGRNNKNKNDGNDDDDDVDIGNKHEKSLLDGDDKLMNEIVADQGKEPGFPDDMHLEEANEEEEDDDYSNPAARQQEGHAVRN